MKDRAKSVEIPPIAAWDFERSEWLDDELNMCCLYEYALEKPEMVKLVKLRRRNRKYFVKGDNSIHDSIIDQWFGDPHRVLVGLPEFPAKHWLEIEPDRRKRILRDWPRSRDFEPSQNIKYTGPEDGHINRLRAERLAWQDIRKEKETVIGWFTSAWDVQSRRRLPDRCRDYLTKSDRSRWKEKLSELEGIELQKATFQLRVECEREIESRRRRRCEMIVYEVDWTLRPEQLEKNFRQWMKANRVHDPRPRSGGHPTLPTELLKALGAKRLLAFFRRHPARLPLPYKNLQLHAALSDYTSDTRKAAGRPAKSLYRNPSGWHTAEKAAAKLLESS